jgi:CRP-like cAMP-binding protein
MSTDQLVALLLHVALFGGLKGSQLAAIAQRAEQVGFAPGDAVVKAGQPGDAAYLVVSGGVDRLDASDRSVARERVRAGYLIGEMAMLIEYNYPATFVAADRVLCLKLTRAAMHAHLRRDPAMIEHLQRRVTERLERMSADLRRVEGTLAGQEAKPHRAPAQVAPAPMRFVAAAKPWR